MNAQSIKSGIETNTRRSVFYTAGDNDTAEWVSEYSGTIMKSITRSETVTTNKAGGEEWGKARLVHKTEEGLIHANMIKNLPERVGILFQPNAIATLIHTCWIPVNKFKGIPTRKDKNSL